jgi:predicted aspartyl protease
MPKKKSLLYHYDQTNFDPPAPVLEISLSKPIVTIHNQIVRLPALIDSGADITVIPQWIPKQLQLKYVDEILVTGYDGIIKATFVYSVKIIFDDLGNFITKTIASDSNYALIGRDILNKWTVLLKGKNKTFEISY